MSLLSFSLPMGSEMNHVALRERSRRVACQKKKIRIAVGGIKLMVTAIRAVVARAIRLGAQNCENR